MILYSDALCKHLTISFIYIAKIYPKPWEEDQCCQQDEYYINTNQASICSDKHRIFSMSLSHEYLAKVGNTDQNYWADSKFSDIRQAIWGVAMFT